MNDPAHAIRPLERLEALLATPHARVSLERQGEVWRLRWRGPNGKRVSVVVPGDPDMIAAMRERLTTARTGRREADRKIRETARADALADRAVNRMRRKLRRRILDASGRGRWIRERIGRAFDRAVSLGGEWLTGFVTLRPWEARPKPAGRPRRPVGGWGSPPTAGRAGLDLAGILEQCVTGERQDGLDDYLTGLRELGLSGHDGWQKVFGWLLWQAERSVAGEDGDGTGADKVTKEERLRRLEELYRQVPDAPYLP